MVLWGRMRIPKLRNSRKDDLGIQHWHDTAQLSDNIDVTMTHAGRPMPSGYPVTVQDIDVPVKSTGSVVNTSKGKRENPLKQSLEMTPLNRSDATQMLSTTITLLQKALV